MMNTKPNILFLADTTHITGAVQDHIQSITAGERIQWHVMNPLLDKTIDKLDWSCFDAVGIHYSIKPYNHYYLSRALKRKLAHFSGVKFLFLQDEYQRVNDVQQYLYDMGFHLLFTLVEANRVDKAYPDPRLQSLKKVTVLTGYVTPEMKTIESPPIKDRTIDVSYRGRSCHFWLGSLAFEKQMIAERFLHYTQGSDLRLNISLEECDRVYGEAWFSLLKQSKAVLGTESGSSIWDFDRSIEKATNRYLSKHRQASFEQVFDAVLKSHDGKILYNAISPRIFEAAATKTPMIMFPGYYSGVCQPNQHYIVLQKDFSNIDEVLQKLQDAEFLQQMADRTFDDLILSDRYSQAGFSQLIETEVCNLLKNRPASAGAETVEIAIQKNQKRYQSLNVFRLMQTEAAFVARNFCEMLLDGKYTFKEKMNVLFKGLKRYVAYLLPRLR